MNPLHVALVSAGLLSSAVLPSAAAAAPLADPLAFWDGRTETVSTVKVLMKKAFRSRSLGQGQIKPDGSLHLVQRVEDEGRPARERRWHIRKVSPKRFVGTMSEAIGPVTIEEVGNRYRFTFKMKGNLLVEQWLTPLPGGKSARSNVTIKKMGVKVGQSDGTVRKLN